MWSLGAGSGKVVVIAITCSGSSQTMSFVAVRTMTGRRLPMPLRSRTTAQTIRPRRNSGRAGDKRYLASGLKGSAVCSYHDCGGLLFFAKRRSCSREGPALSSFVLSVERRFFGETVLVVAMMASRPLHYT
jgi:hypothetical protein